MPTKNLSQNQKVSLLNILEDRFERNLKRLFNHLKLIQNFNSHSASRIIANIDGLSYSDEGTFEQTGKFRALNCDTGHYIFISVTEETFSGYMDKLIKEGSERIVFTKLYHVKIRRKITKEASKGKPKIEDTIMAFFEMD